MIKNWVGTVVSACLAGAVGIGLFFIKHEVKEQEARLAELNRDIQRNQESIHVLKAEWSFLNDPARLRHLSEKYLGMRVMSPNQIATLNSLPNSPAAPVLARVEPTKLVKLAAVVAKPAPLMIADSAPAAVAAPAHAVAAPARTAIAAPMPATPSRSIVIYSPALAQTQAPAGEVR